MKPFRSKSYRDAGKGLKCCFCRMREATDAAHIRLPGLCGTGQKPPDVMIIDACRQCHETFGDMNLREDARWVLAALCRTLVRRAELGWFDD